MGIQGRCRCLTQQIRKRAYQIVDSEIDPVKYISFVKERIVEVSFNNPYSTEFLFNLSGNTHAVFMIFLHGLIPLLLTYFWLRKKYS